MAHMVNEQAGGATHQQQSIPEYQQQTLTEQHQVLVQTSASPTPQPTQHVQAQVQQPFVSQEVATPQAIDWSAQIADVMRNQFGLQPKELAVMYHKPYPEAYDMIALPSRYRVPDFTKFSGYIG